MSLLSRLLARIGRRRAPAPPLANFNAIFAPPEPDQAHPADLAEAPDPIADAIRAAPLEPAPRSEALVAWAGIAHEQPDLDRAIQTLLIQLARPRLLPARQTVAEAAIAAFPDQSWPHAQSAAAALAAGQPDAALATMRAAAARFPADPDIAHALLDALAATGAHAEAHAVCTTLADGPVGPALRQQDWFLRHAIISAHRAANHPGTLAWSARLRALQPDAPASYSMACAALRALGRPGEAVSLVEAGLRACPDSIPLVLEAAHAAEAAGQPDAAYAHWARLRELTPRNPAGHVGAARLSVRLAQPERTQALLHQGLAAFPADRDLLQIAAREAISRFEWDQAATYWDALIALSADKPALALTAAQSFIGPVRGRKQRLPGVLARMEAIHAAHPGFVPARTAYLQTLREAGRQGEAATHGDAFASLFPTDHGLTIARARIAEDQGRLAVALHLLQSTRSVTPRSEAMEAANIRLLRLSDSLEDAEAAATQALARFPQSVSLLSEQVAIATRGGDFAAALARARAASQALPNNQILKGVLRRAELDAIGHAAPAAATPTEAPAADILASFESLGAATAGCEFGLFQRACGVETLGLLRWASLPIEGLTAALHTRFQGFGDPDNTVLSIRRASADNQEYCLADRTYGFWTHTFVKTDAMPHEMMLKQSIRRLAFLRGKLLEDLDAGEKIFTYKLATPDPDAAFGRLFDALSLYGPRTLLCVARDTPEHPKGTLRMPRPGLFIGHATMVADTAGPDMRIDTDNWRSLCERVAAWHGGRPGALPLDPAKG